MEFFELVKNVRAMRRLKTDPVPLSLLRKVLGAAVHAPSGMNSQPWSFLILQNPEDRAFFADLYRKAAASRGAGQVKPRVGSRLERAMGAFSHQLEHLQDAPILLLACGVRDWPFAVPEEKRVGPAPPNYGALYPCIQNILLGCREVGLGAALTTLHQLFPDEIAERFRIPDTWGVVAVLPIGFPTGKFGPTRRIPAEERTYFDRFGDTEASRWSGVDANA